MKSYGLLAVLTSILFACQVEQPKDLVINEIQVPSQSGGEPNLFLDQSDQLHLSWLENLNDSSVVLLHTTLEDSGFTSPQEIAQGSNWFVNWADFPSVAVFPGEGDQIAAHWLQKRAIGTYDYDVRVSISEDSGNSWNPSFILHQDGIAAEHGFVTLLPLNNGRIMGTWLDGRNTKMENESMDASEDGHHPMGGAMTLRSAEFDTNGQLYAEAELDARVCDCCQTDVALAKNGPVVVYRDRSDKEVRDISIVRSVEGQWTKPQSIAQDNWEIMGCPVNGPAIAANGDQVVIAWFTGARDSFKVQAIFSSDGGASFSEPLRVDDGDPSGRVDVVWKDNEQAIVSWVETVEEEGEVRIALVNPSGKVGSSSTLTTINPSRRSGFPILEKKQDQYYLAFTEVAQKETRVRFLNFSWD